MSKFESYNVGAVLTGDGQFTPTLTMGPGKFAVSIYGIYSGFVWLQKKHPSQADTEWRFVRSYSSLTSAGASIDDIVETAATFDYRLGFVTGNYGSGSAKAYLSWM